VISWKALKVGNVKRYGDIARLLMKYGRSDLVKQVGLDKAVPEGAKGDGDESSSPEELARDLEALGPTYIKIGQILSTRADMLPFEYLEALSRLQDDVAPFPYEQIQKTVEEELGVRIHKAFPEFEERPMAAASLGQVHRATLPSGRQVAVKVQRPDVARQIQEDFDALQVIAEALDKHTEIGRKYEFVEMLKEVRENLLRELDYTEEARNLETLRRNLKDFPRLVVPAPVTDFTTARVLTMDHIQGTKITTISPVALLEVDRFGLLKQLFDSYLHQILVDGFFHADPHPGNVFLTEDKRIALLDLGMVSRVAPMKQDTVLKLLLAVSEGRGEEAADFTLEMSELRSNSDEALFKRSVTQLVLNAHGINVRQSRYGHVFMSLQRIAADSGVRLPAEIRMIGKALLNLERVVTVLDDTFNPTEAIRDNALRVMRQRLYKDLSTTNLISNLAEIKEFAQRFPRRMNRLFEMLERNEFEVHVDAIDEDRLMAGFQKIANRITTGLVLASMIVGAALITRVETEFTLLGYPGLAILLFLAAALGGIILLIDILWVDVKDSASVKKRK